MILIFVLLPMGAILLSVVFWSLRNGISPMPTARKVKRTLLKVLPRDINGPIYELGSGWGTLLEPLYRLYPNQQIIGFETSPVPRWFSKLRLLYLRQDNVRVDKRDFFTQDLGGAGMVVCYLYPGAMARLRPKLAAELKEGTWVVSHTFAIPGWQAWQVYEVNDLYRTKIYAYRVSGA